MSIASFLATEEDGFSSTISLGHILCLRQFYSPLLGLLGRYLDGFHGQIFEIESHIWLL